MKHSSHHGRRLTASLALFGLLGACSGQVDSDTAEVATQQDNVVGGNAALLGEWPWQVQINRNGSHSCGGSVISANYVLTAAHCVDGVNAAQLTLRTGLINRAVPGPNVQSRTVTSIQIHPDWDSAAINNDVALLQLNAPLTFDAYTQPIDIAEEAPPVGSSAYVTGWGWTSSGGSSSNLLMEARLPVRSNAVCDGAGTLPLPMEDEMICAGYLTGEHGGCHGDSGGPLVVPSASFSGGWRQIGVVSWGVGYYCSSYTVFSRLSELAGWINGITGGASVVGDVNSDGCVDMTDYNAVMSDYGDAVPPGNPDADLNSDGVINIQDRMIVLQNFGEGC